MNKRAAASLAVIILLVGALVIVGYEYGVLNVGTLTGSGSYIERPVFKYVKCEALSALKYSVKEPLAKNGEWVPKPSVSSSYNVRVTIKKTPFGIGTHKLGYAICNSKTAKKENCREIQKVKVTKGQVLTISDVRQEEFVKLEYVLDKGIIGATRIQGADYQIGFVPYGLREYDVLSGSSNPVNPNDCIVSSSDDSWRDRFLSTDSNKVDNQISKNTNERRLQPEEVRWFVSGYLTSAEPSFVLKYRNQDAWCRTTGSSAEIYKINKVKLGSGTYKIANPDWSDYLGSETCCPTSTRADEVCNKNFKWEQIKGSECGSFKSCGSPNWVPYTENEIIKYSCVNGRCVSETKEVDCASDYDCKDSNQICNLNTFKCVDANVNLKGQVIETLADNQADCQAKGGQWITSKKKKYDPLSLVGVTEPTLLINEYCDMPSKTNWLLYILIALGIIGAAAFWKPLLTLIKQIPYIGRLIPI